MFNLSAKIKGPNDPTIQTLAHFIDIEIHLSTTNPATNGYDKEQIKWQLNLNLNITIEKASSNVNYKLIINY